MEDLLAWFLMLLAGTIGFIAGAFIVEWNSAKYDEEMLKEKLKEQELDTKIRLAVAKALSDSYIHEHMCEKHE